MSYHIARYFGEANEEHAERLGWGVSATHRWRLCLLFFARAGRTEFTRLVTEKADKPIATLLTPATRGAFIEHMTRGGVWEFLYNDDYTLNSVMGMLAVKWDPAQELFVPTVLDNGYGMTRYFEALHSEGVNALRGAYDAQDWADIKQGRALQGLPNASRPPYGYTLVGNGQFLPCPGEWSVVRWIFAAYLAIGNFRTVARRLDARGIVTQQGDPWLGKTRQDGNAVREVLFRKPVYLGRIAYKGTWLPGIHVPLVSLAVYTAVRDIRDGAAEPWTNGDGPRGRRLWAAENAVIQAVADQQRLTPVAPFFEVLTEADILDVATAFEQGLIPVDGGI